MFQQIEVMAKFSVRKSIDNVKRCFAEFPMETLSGVVFFLLYVVFDSIPRNTLTGYDYFLEFFPAVVMSTYFCGRVCRGLARSLYYLVLPVSVAVMFLCVGSLRSFVTSTAYPFMWLLVILLFFGYRQSPDNVEFSRRAMRRFFNMVFSVVFGGLLVIAFMLIVASLEYIFSVDTGRLFSYVPIAVGCLLTPLLLFSMQAKSEREAWHAPAKWLEVLFNYVLNPGIVIYTVILYVYAVTVLVSWNLPKGGIAAMVFAFFIVSFFGRLSQTVVSRPLFRWYYRYQTLFSLPLLVLFWTGSLYRLQTYGFTESRVYLLVGGVLMTLFLLSLFSRRWGQLRLMLGISATAIVVFTYIPGISAKSIGIRVQEHRMIDHAKAVGLWNESSGKLKGTAEFATADSLKIRHTIELSASHSYLCDAVGYEEAERRYGENKLSAAYRYRNSGKKEISYSEVVFVRAENSVLDVSGYTRYIPGADWMKASGRCDTVVYTDRGVQHRIPVDLQAHFAPYEEELKRCAAAGEYRQRFRRDEAFVIRNDTLMIVFDEFLRCNQEQTYQFGYSSDITVFVR